MMPKILLMVRYQKRRPKGAIVFFSLRRRSPYLYVEGNLTRPDPTGHTLMSHPAFTLRSRSQDNH